MTKKKKEQKRETYWIIPLIEGKQGKPAHKNRFIYFQLHYLWIIYKMSNEKRKCKKNDKCSPNEWIRKIISKQSRDLLRINLIEILFIYVYF